MSRKRANLSASPCNVGAGRERRRRLGRISLCVLLVPVLCVAGYFGSALSLRPAQSSVGSETDLQRFRSYRMVPEYDRRLKEVLICVGTATTSLAGHHEILSRLPEYSQVLLLIPETSRGAIERDLKGKSYADRVRLVPYGVRPQPDLLFYLVFSDKDHLVAVKVGGSDKVRQLDSVWAQDLFEVTTGASGKAVLLVPRVHKYFTATAGDRDQRLVPDNMCLDVLRREGLEIERLPLTFRGGNVLVDEIGGRRIGLVGGDTFRLCRAAAQAFAGPAMSESAVIERFKETLNVDEVVAVGGPSTQPEQMFHLDQAVILLHGGVAAVTRVVGDLPKAPAEARKIVEVKKFLSELRLALVSLGYRIVDIQTSAHNVLNFEYYVNAIAYVDADTDRRTILMPVFTYNQTDLDKELVRRNSLILGSLGYEVLHVPTRANRLHGGIHCLVNVLK